MAVRNGSAPSKPSRKEVNEAYLGPFAPFSYSLGRKLAVISSVLALQKPIEVVTMATGMVFKRPQNCIFCIAK